MNQSTTNMSHILPFGISLYRKIISGMAVLLFIGFVACRGSSEDPNNPDPNDPPHLKGVELVDITPNIGSELGGTKLTITGKFIVPGSKVRLGGYACLSLEVESSKVITCVTPPHSLGKVEVIIENPDNNIARLQNGFDFQSFPILNTANGSLGFPAGVTVDVSGNVFVADSLHHRIVKFNSSGEFVSTFGSLGTASGQFNTPSGIALDAAGNIFVADRLNHRIQKFNSSGSFLMAFGSYGSASNQMAYPTGIAVDAAGNIIVSESLDVGETLTPNQRIHKFNSTNGASLMTFGSLGSAPGQFSSPTGVAVDAANNIYVADRFNNRIQKFDSAGTFVMMFGSHGTFNGQMDRPTGITVDAAGKIFVADRFNNRIQKFNSAGGFVMKIGGTAAGSAPGKFNIPYAVAVDVLGNIFVADTGNNRIQRFQDDGSIL